MTASEVCLLYSIGGLGGPYLQKCHKGYSIFRLCKGPRKKTRSKWHKTTSDHQNIRPF